MPSFSRKLTQNSKQQMSRVFSQKQLNTGTSKEDKHSGNLDGASDCSGRSDLFEMQKDFQTNSVNNTRYKELPMPVLSP